VVSSRLRRWLPPAVALVVIVVLWELLARFGPWPHFLFPTPAKVLESFAQLVASGRFLPSLKATATRLLVGFSIAMVVGVAMALLMTRFPVVRRALKPYLLGMQSLPGIAWVPFAILWFGYSEQALIFVCAIESVFAVTIAFADALALVPVHTLWAARTMGSRGLHLVLRVGLPAALPNLVSGTKQCWAFAWRGLIGAEIVFAGLGLGFLLQQGREFLDPAQVLAMMLCTLGVGAIVEILLFSRLEVRLKRRWGLLSG